jgi:hypothetical protein
MPNVVADEPSHPTSGIAALANSSGCNLHSRHRHDQLRVRDMVLRQILYTQVKSLCSSKEQRNVMQKVADLDLLSDGATDKF